MNKIEFRHALFEPNHKILSFQTNRPHSKQFAHKSKSNKKPSNLTKQQKNISPSEAVAPFKADKDNISRNNKNQHSFHNNPNCKRQKTDNLHIQEQYRFQNQSWETNDIEQNKCINHPEKRGDFFVEGFPEKKFCLKCHLALNEGNYPSQFTTKQSKIDRNNLEHHKKACLDNFRTDLEQTRSVLTKNSQTLVKSLCQSEKSFFTNSNYINESFNKIIEQLEEKKRQMLNNLIIAQDRLKTQFEQNLIRIKKMTKTLDRYQLDILKFYEEIIESLPKEQFDQIMKEYEEKLTKNIKSKLQRMILKDGLIVYVPNLEIRNLIQQATVSYYQPIGVVNWQETKRKGKRVQVTKEDRARSSLGQREQLRIAANSLETKGQGNRKERNMERLERTFHEDLNRQVKKEKTAYRPSLNENHNKQNMKIQNLIRKQVEQYQQKQN